MPDETPEVNTSWRNGSAGEGRYWVCLQQQVPKEDIMTDQMGAADAAVAEQDIRE